MQQSKQFMIGRRDLLRSLAMAILGAIVTGLYDALTGTQGFNFTWPEFIGIFKIGGIAGLAYLIKNFFTPPDKK